MTSPGGATDQDKMSAMGSDRKSVAPPGLVRAAGIWAGGSFWTDLTPKTRLNFLWAHLDLQPLTKMGLLGGDADRAVVGVAGPHPQTPDMSHLFS
jgi:hypothetical protein